MMTPEQHRRQADLLRKFRSEDPDFEPHLRALNLELAEHHDALAAILERRLKRQET
jgi:hypothetical protein